MIWAIPAETEEFFKSNAHYLMHIGPIVPGSGCFTLSGRIRVSKVHVRVRVSLITVRIRVRLGL